MEGRKQSYGGRSHRGFARLRFGDEKRHAIKRLSFPHPLRLWERPDRISQIDSHPGDL